MDRFVKPQIVRLPLSGGDWIEVKRRLNTGEEHDLFARMLPPLVTPGEKMQLQSKEVLLAKVSSYLLGWSLTDNGQPVSITDGALRNLDPDTFGEIRDAIDAHETAVTTEIELAKKNLTGASEWKVPSGSAEP